MARRLLVAVDMDGTLIDTEAEDRLRPRELASLAAVRAAGHVVAICTGRNRQSLDSLLDRSGWHPADLPKVLLNGAMVDGGAGHGVLAHNVIHRPVIARLVGLYREHGALPMVFGADHDGGGLRLQAGAPNPVMERYLAHRRDQVGAQRPPGPSGRAARDGARVGTIDLHEVIQPLTAAVRAALRDEVRVINTRSLLGGGRYHWAEAYHHACSKGTGVRLLASALRIAPSRIVAIGDNTNDLDMFAEAAVSVAMAGGPAEVQAAADRLTGSAAEGGAAAVLEDIAAGRFALPAVPDEESA
ncbi:MAG: HAD family hydrolase [Candidatus Krumholzibacteriia bacterium]